MKFTSSDKQPSKTASVVETLIGRQTEIVGDTSFSGGLHVDGVLIGAVIAKTDKPAHLSVSENGRIEGEVRVPTIVLNGVINGDVHALEKITLGGKARVNGNVVYRSLEMQAGAQVNGRLTHESNVPQAITHQQEAGSEATAESAASAASNVIDGREAFNPQQAKA